MINMFQESTASASLPSSNTGWFSELYSMATQGMKTYFDYDLQREQNKLAKQQIAAGYSSGSQYPGAYDYTRFTDDGGLMGGFGGLKGDQVFMLGMAAIAVFAVARSR